MDSQILIKILLIICFTFFSFILLAPMKGARNQAIRRIVLIFALFFVVLAVVFPQWVNILANILGVGRGTDLVLYVVAIFVVGSTISNSRKHQIMQKEITILARKMALSSENLLAPIEQTMDEKL